MSAIGYGILAFMLSVIIILKAFTNTTLKISTNAKPLEVLLLLLPPILIGLSVTLIMWR